MTTIEFLKAELKDYESSAYHVAANFNEIVKKAVAGGMGEHDAIISVEAVHRSLKERRDFLCELVAKAEQVAK